MRILHTSDWHLGRALHGRRRDDECQAFLDWLYETVERERIDVLIVAGDVFDSSAPSNHAQEMYYRFLGRVAAEAGRQVVVVAGNHDSPAFLDAPRFLLKALDVHVVGLAAEQPRDEVVVIAKDSRKPPTAPGNAMGIVCAVPYLRDRDVRQVAPGESVEDKSRKLVEGIVRHYQEVGTSAAGLRDALTSGEHSAAADPLPIVGVGHLFAAGGRTVEGDGVRELYVGSLAQVPADAFPSCFDYVALGHLHVPQTVGRRETVRYSGSPLPIGFGEATQPKSVVVVDFDPQTPRDGAGPQITTITVPVFQRLECVRGDLDAIEARLCVLKADGAPVWLEIVYEGDAVVGDLRERLADAVAGSPLEILRIKNLRIADRALGSIRDEESLGDLDAFEVFDRCLGAHDVPEEQRDRLRAAYREIVVQAQDAATPPEEDGR